MRLRSSILVIAAAVVLASPAVARASQRDGNYKWGIGKYECVGTGGKLGGGWVYIHGAMQELGTSGINYMKIDFQRQYYGGYGSAASSGSWHSDRWHTAESPHFPDDARNFWYAAGWRFPSDPAEASGELLRIKVTFKWYDAIFGPDWRKHREVMYTPTCTPTIGYGWPPRAGGRGRRRARPGARPRRGSPPRRRRG